tara:strand:+ start:875 stop:1369 length:495 start_codon:yes stop_codon:yes gene_type:complete
VLTSLWFYLIIAAVVIVGGLAFYAGTLLMKLKQQTSDQKIAKQKQLKAHDLHDKKILSSVIIIVRAMKEKQCDISEGCWRLSVLLDSLKTVNNLNLKFPAIFNLYSAIKHMPILAERKNLDKKQRMKLDFERMKVEAELSPAIFDNLDLLHTFALKRANADSQH